jgi:Ca-activated chloride channel family protein
MAVKAFSAQEKKYKSLIIISDGEDHDAHALAAVKDAVDQGVVIHTVGIGSVAGARIIDPVTGSEKLDEQGNPVVSKLNEAELQAIAAGGRGTYSLLSNTDRVADKLVHEIDGMEQRKLGVVEYVAYNNYFQYFLAFAFALLLLEWVIPAVSRKVKPQSL